MNERQSLISFLYRMVFGRACDNPEPPDEWDVESVALGFVQTHREVLIRLAEDD